MAYDSKLNRRSFFGRIVGAAAGAGAMSLIVGGRARSQPTDMDQNDDVGRKIPYNGINDHDHNDVAGHGRGLYTGHTDHDGQDQSRYGRNLPNTDRDRADRAGHGRTATPPATPGSSSGQ
jgi:hypothetical protein